VAIPEDVVASVILGFDPQQPIGQLLAGLASQIELEDGRTILHFWCSNVDLGIHYADLTAYSPSTGQRSRYSVPHAAVLLIVWTPLDEESVRRVGFV
jgi:hypothetical protein